MRYFVGIMGSGRFFADMYHWMHPAKVFAAGFSSVKSNELGTKKRRFNSVRSLVKLVTNVPAFLSRVL